MTPQTEQTRAAALRIVEEQGYQVERVGKGQRFVVHLTKDGQRRRALVKVASLGSAMVRTDVDDADRAKISGFESDVDSVLFAVGERNSTSVSAYLVPISVVEEAYRSSHRVWRSTRPIKAVNLTWVIWFNDAGAPECSGFARTWSHYRLGNNARGPGRASVELPSPADHDRLQRAIESAKQRIAAEGRLRPDQVKIVIEF
jgi:hypothetical protein